MEGTGERADFSFKSYYVGGSEMVLGGIATRWAAKNSMKAAESGASGQQSRQAGSAQSGRGASGLQVVR